MAKKFVSILFIGGLILGAGVFLLASGQAVGDQGIRVKDYTNGPGNRPAFVDNEILVKYADDAKPFRVVKVGRGQVLNKIKEFQNKKGVEYAGPNYIAQAHMAPNDPLYSFQWHFDSINMESAWDSSTGNGATVAVIDTGIAQNAPDLANTCFVPGHDYAYNDSDPSDDNGHGTHVAGTIAQSTSNNLGVAGVAFNACLMPIKVLRADGYGSYDAITNGIYFAADNGAHVINLSLGGSLSDPLMEEAINYAYNKGVTIVASAGNDGRRAIGYPARYTNVIAVGATRYDNTKANYSNFGPGLDLVAPGGDITVDQNNDGYADGVLQETFDGNPNEFAYYFFQGTSMAAPHVSGVASLLISQGASSPDEVRSILESTALDLDKAGWDQKYGHGLLDAAAALGGSSGPVDEDGDGYSSADDCDDTNPFINPGAQELCDDGLDNDCDGFIDTDDDDCGTVEPPDPEPSSCGDGICDRRAKEHKTCPEDCSK